MTLSNQKNLHLNINLQKEAEDGNPPKLKLVKQYKKAVKK